MGGGRGGSGPAPGAAGRANFECVAKQLFDDMATSATEKVAVKGQNMRAKPCRIISTDGKPTLDVFRQQDGGW